MQNDVDKRLSAKEITELENRDHRLWLAANALLYFVLWVIALCIWPFWEEAVLVAGLMSVYLAFGMGAAGAMDVWAKNYLFAMSYFRAYWPIALFWPFIFIWRGAKQLRKLPHIYRS